MSLDLSNLQYKDIKYLLAVYRLKSFRDAAKVCGVTQATVSGQISKIERLFNLKLIERNSRKVEFTEAGKAIIDRCFIINEEFKILAEIGLIEQNKSQNKEQNSLQKIEFSIGVVPTLDEYYLNVLQPILKEAFPDLNFKVSFLTTPLILQEMAYNNLDFSIATRHDSITDDTLTSLSLGFDELLLVCNESVNIEFTDGKVDPRSLEDKKFFMLSEGHCLRDQVYENIQNIIVTNSKNDYIDQRYSVSSIDTLKLLAYHNLCVSVLPRLSLRDGLYPNTVVHSLPCKPSREVIFVYPSRSLYPEIYNKVGITLQQAFVANNL